MATSAHRSGSYFFLGMLIAAAVLVAFVFLPELNVIVLGVSLAVLFEPWFAALARSLNGRRDVAAAIIVFLAVALVLIPLVFFGLQIFGEAQALYGTVKSGQLNSELQA